jgi:hypothetical protein
MDSKMVTVTAFVNILEASLILVAEWRQRFYHAPISQAEEGRTLVP